MRWWYFEFHEDTFLQYFLQVVPESLQDKLQFHNFHFLSLFTNQIKDDNTFDELQLREYMCNGGVEEDFEDIIRQRIGLCSEVQAWLVSQYEISEENRCCPIAKLTQSKIFSN